MRELADKVAVVTGGASGIGYALARGFLQAGMKVVLADVEQASLDRAAAELKLLGEVLAVACDVADRNSVQAMAKAAVGAFGKVHVLCNNAGVGAGGLQEQIDPKDWDWVLDVNLKGVIHGVQAFLPLIKAQGEGGHVVNTASMAGMNSAPMMGPYCASKFAVVALSEGLAGELAGSNIGVTLLCPGWVRTRLHQSGRNRPGGPPPAAPASPMIAMVTQLIENGMSPDTVAERVLEAIREGRLYVFTHPEMRGPVEERFRRIQAALDEAEQWAAARKTAATAKS